MDYPFIKVQHIEIAGKEMLDFDIFNFQGEIIQKKGQKIDPGLLLMLNYTTVYKKIENISDKEFSIEKLGFSQTVYEKVESFLLNNKTVLFITGDENSGVNTTAAVIHKFMKEKNKKTVFHEELPQTLDFAGESDNCTVVLYSKNIFEAIKILKSQNLTIPQGTLAAILAQKRVKKLCNACKEKYRPDNEQVDRYFNHVDDAEVYFYSAKGCSSCNHTGVSGSIHLHEFVSINQDIMDLISETCHDADIIRQLNASGFADFKNDGLKKVLFGLISIDEVMAA